MEEIKLKKVNEVIYKHVLDNGLKIYIYKKPDYQKKLCFFETKYGSINNVFIPNGKKEYRDVPLGIAHFLEHKLFESNEDENVFEAFEKDGAYVNAATSYDKTYYYFDTVDNFESCLIRLIDFVQNPCFTDENVEKEKGIIHQEIDMRNDNPNGFIYSKLVENVLVQSQYKYDIGGTKEDVNKITKEDLYECYNTFYHPSNMVLVIAGDIDVKNTIKLIEDNQKKKKYSKKQEIVQKTFKESDEVAIKEISYIHNVSTKKIGYVYKMNFDRKSDIDTFKFYIYIDIYFRILLGDTSSFVDDVVKEGLVKSYLDWYYDIFDNDNMTLLLFFIADAIDESKLKERIDIKLKEKEDYEKMFNLWKKVFIASYIRRFESIESVVSLIRKCVSKYESVLYDYYDILKSINYDEFIKVISNLHYDNYSKVVLDKEEGSC